MCKTTSCRYVFINECWNYLCFTVDRNAMMTKLNATDGLKRSSEEENMKKNEDNVQDLWNTIVCVCTRAHV